MPSSPESGHPRSRTRIYAAFACIYLVWGSTFLAIRVCVRAMPPLFFGALRFSIAGILLYTFLKLRGERSPTRQEWLGAFLMGVLIFVGDYGVLFWAEQVVPSGVAAVMMAMIPGFMALSEIVILRTRRLTGRLILALLIGLGGVAVLMSHSAHTGQTSAAAISFTGGLALLFAALSWSVSSSVSRRIALPRSQSMNAAAQMLAGSVLLAILAAGFGQLHTVNVRAWTPHVWIALLYLIFMGSLVTFQAYVWLIHHESPTKVGTYAYVNPVIAVLLGYFVGGEPLGIRTLLGSVFVLLSVVLITTMRSSKTDPAPALAEPT